jgi:hypothetical protein
MKLLEDHNLVAEVAYAPSIVLKVHVDIESQSLLVGNRAQVGEPIQWAQLHLQLDCQVPQDDRVH